MLSSWAAHSRRLGKPRSIMLRAVHGQFMGMRAGRPRSPPTGFPISTIQFPNRLPSPNLNFQSGIRTTPPDWPRTNATTNIYELLAAVIVRPRMESQREPPTGERVFLPVLGRACPSSTGCHVVYRSVSWATHEFETEGHGTATRGASRGFVGSSWAVGFALFIGCSFAAAWKATLHNASRCSWAVHGHAGGTPTLPSHRISNFHDPISK